MKAIHRDPGPHGFIVETDDGTLLAEGLTQEQAFLLVCGGVPPKVRGNSNFNNIGTLTYHSGIRLTVDQVDREKRRHQREWYPHEEGQGPNQ